VDLEGLTRDRACPSKSRSTQGIVRRERHCLFAITRRQERKCDGHGWVVILTSANVERLFGGSGCGGGFQSGGQCFSF
jgi:hypothetical protein